MDNTALVGTIAGSIAVIIGALAKLNHKRLRSTCCGFKEEISIDIDSTSPVVKDTTLVDKDSNPKV
jgi:hypothetical protein